MTGQPLVSVIINCYNGEKYLREAIDSVLAQTYQNWEIIFWDNQSTDTTAEIVKSYGDSRIHYIYAPDHTPLGLARNEAMKIASGDYLSFLDADDKWLPRFLEFVVEIMIKNDTFVGVYSNYYDVYPQKKVVHIQNVESKREALCDLLNDYRICMSGVVLNRSFLMDNGISFNQSYNLIEDLDFYCQVAARGTLYYYNEVLVEYRRNPDSLSYKMSRYWYDEYTQFIELMQNDFVAKGLLKNTDLNKMRNLQAEAFVELKIQDGDRLGLLKYYIDNLDNFSFLWKKTLFLLVGKRLYLLIRERRLRT